MNTNFLYNEPIVTNVSKQIADEVDNIIYGVFERHGYSRDEVNSLLEQGRIKKTGIREIEIISVDDKVLFGMTLNVDTRNYRFTVHIIEDERKEYVVKKWEDS